MKGMRRVKKAINARRRPKKGKALHLGLKLAGARLSAKRYIPKKLIAHLGKIKAPPRELITLYRGFAKVFKEAKSLDETSKKHLMEKAIEMLDPNSFQKFLHKVNAKLVVARLQTIANILRPREKFSFKYKKEHLFPDGHIEKGVYVMNVPNIGEVALFSIYFNPVLNRNYVWYVQGVKGVDMRKVLKAIGKPWYRAIMDEIIRSAKELYGAGGKIAVHYGTESKVYEKIKTEYLEEGGTLGMFLPLDPKKPRVKKLFAELELKAK